jgi:hypothetical protein
LGAAFCDAIEEDIRKGDWDAAGYRIGMLTFLSGPALGVLMKFLKEGIEKGELPYMLLWQHMNKEAFVWTKDHLREWEARPESLEIAKLMIKANIEVLIDPAAWQEELLGSNPSEYVNLVRKAANSLEKFIFDRLDILGGQGIRNE